MKKWMDEIQMGGNEDKRKGNKKTTHR